MDDASLLALCVGGFFGGLLVISRTLGWLAGLLLMLRPARDGSSPSKRSWPVQLFLHSGPWLLALAVMAFVRVAAMPWPALGALGGGFGFALSLVGIAVGRAAWRRRHPPAAPLPLTPERLAEQKREFLFLTISATTIFNVVGCAWWNWSTLDRDYPIVILVAIGSPLAAYLYALVMWQFFGASWKEIERARRRRAEREAMAARSVR